MTATFTQAWDSTSDKITLTASADIDRNTTVVVDIAGATLPMVGFPMHYKNSRVTISATSVNGNVDPSSFDEITTVRL